MTWRLGLDIGTNSIGIAVLRLGAASAPFSVSGIEKLAVRIFSDGRNAKSKQSLAANRREARGMRRNRDRRLDRNKRLMARLQSAGLLPPDSTGAAYRALSVLDPYILRHRALSEELPPFEIGRALFHLKRRGFKSNRKTAAADNEGGKIRDGAARTEQLLLEEGCLTLGDYFGRQRLAHLAANAEKKRGSRAPSPATRVRLKGKGASASYDLYPTRAMILDEFDKIWRSQQRFHPDLLTEERRATIRETLAFQHDLKPQPVGKCSLDPTKERAAKCLPSVQRFRILQELNNLQIACVGERARRLSLEERNILRDACLAQGKLTFVKLRKLLGLTERDRINLESEKRKHLDGDLTAARLAGKALWGKDWRDLPSEAQEQIVLRLIGDEEDAALAAWLQTEHGFDAKTADRILRAPLPAGHAALSSEAISTLAPLLELDVTLYSEAVAASPYRDHADLDSGEMYADKLPYYGQILERHVAFGTGDPNDPPEKRYGKIANPTVHVALNQLRHVVNDLIKSYGPPSQIVVETARDLPLSAVGKRDLEKRQSSNQTRNDAIRKELTALNVPDSYQNRLRFKLWEELGDTPLERRCVFSGEQISTAALFTDRVEVEHILPFSRTLDDGVANKTLAMREANRDKGNRTPFEAFHDSPTGYDWKAVTARAAALPKNKQWRFAEDAMQRFENEEADFLARHLVDTSYIARLAAAYLKRTGADVWVTPGRLTADLRWALGLNSVLPGHNREAAYGAAEAAKNRNDHRHHAVDALVVGLTDRSLLQFIATEAGRREQVFDSRLIAGLPAPWAAFREDVQARLAELIVSHKPDHGVQGALLEETAYGFVKDTDGKPTNKVVHRVAVADIGNAKRIADIRDPMIRAAFLKLAETTPAKDLTKTLVQAGEAMNPPVRKVRVWEEKRVVPIRDRTGKAYKGYPGGSNHCVDIIPDAKGVWKDHVISRFEANQPGFSKKPPPDAIMRLHINDLVEADIGNGKTIFRVVKMTAGKITMAPHYEAGDLKKRNEAKPEEDGFHYWTASASRMQIAGARRVFLSPAGFVRHVGNLF